MSKLFSTARKEAGFTLIELLTVIVIIGILAAIATPMFLSQRARAQDTQTLTDVRNIAITAESLLADPKLSFDDITKSSIDFKSSPNVSWNISGKASLGGYCVVAKNTVGKKYTTDATALTYDSLAGGVGKSGGACNQTTNPVIPNGSTYNGAGANNTAAPTNVSMNRNSQTSATVNWTIPTDTTVTGYLVQRASTNDDAAFTTIGTVTSRTTSSYTDTAAPSAVAYYRLISTTAAGTSSAKSTVATLAAYFTPSITTYNAWNTNGSGGNVQSFTVAETGVYKIDAWGGPGGYANGAYYPSLRGGYGAAVTGAQFSLTAGQKLNIVVGQAGSPEWLYGTNGAGLNAGIGAGGGGGTFVYSTTNELFVVAGGGGGTNSWTNQANGEDATGIGGTGLGGTATGSSGGGGAGWLTSGANAASTGLGGSTKSSWEGGTTATNCSGKSAATGGFGGGGTAGCSGGGAGGGYTGGSSEPNTTGRAGTSFVASTSLATANYALNNAVTGKVVITRVG